MPHGHRPNRSVNEVTERPVASHIKNAGSAVRHIHAQRLAILKRNVVVRIKRRNPPVHVEQPARHTRERHREVDTIFRLPLIDQGRRKGRALLELRLSHLFFSVLTHLRVASHFQSQLLTRRFAREKS